MAEEIVLEKMTEILDAEDEVTMATELDSLEEWDSLSVVSYVAMANAACGRKIEVKKVRDAVTLQDLYDMLQ